MKKRIPTKIKLFGICLLSVLCLLGCRESSSGTAEMTENMESVLPADRTEDSVPATESAAGAEPEAEKNSPITGFAGEENDKIGSSRENNDRDDGHGNKDDREINEEGIYSAATDIPKAEVEEFAGKIRQQFLAHDWAALSEEIAYPITIDDVVYHDSGEFLAAGWDGKLNKYFLVELEEENCKNMFSNWQGIMLGATGRVWIAEALNDDLSSRGLKIMAVNGLTKSFGLPGQVNMTIVEDSATPTSVKLLLNNDTNLEIMFGDDYRLKKYEGAEWKELEPLAGDIQFHDIAYVPKRGQPMEWKADWSSYYGPLEPGSYLIEKNATDFVGTGDYDSFVLSCGFIIEDQ